MYEVVATWRDEYTDDITEVYDWETEQAAKKQAAAAIKAKVLLLATRAAGGDLRYMCNNAYSTSFGIGAGSRSGHGFVTQFKDFADKLVRSLRRIKGVEVEFKTESTHILV